MEWQIYSKNQVQAHTFGQRKRKNNFTQFQCLHVEMAILITKCHLIGKKRKERHENWGKSIHCLENPPIRFPIFGF